VYCSARGPSACGSEAPAGAEAGLGADSEAAALVLLRLQAAKAVMMKSENVAALRRGEQVIMRRTRIRITGWAGRETHPFGFAQGRLCLAPSLRFRAGSIGRDKGGATSFRDAGRYAAA